MFIDIVMQRAFRAGVATHAELRDFHSDYFFDFRFLETTRNAIVRDALKTRIQNDATHAFLDAVFKGITIRQRVQNWIDDKVG